MANSMLRIFIVTWRFLGYYLIYINIYKLFNYLILRHYYYI